MAIDLFDGKYRFLSNFWECTILMDGKVYPSVEHAYQAAKTLNDANREKIRLAPNARTAKALGKRFRLREDWEEVKIPIMSDLVWEKFQHPTLKAQLIATGDKELIEGNWWGDTFWGVCRGEGQNHLGKILMEVRTKLRSQDAIQ